MVSGAQPKGMSLQLGVLVSKAGSAVMHGLPAGLCLPVKTEKKGGNCRSNLNCIANPCRAVQRCSRSSQTCPGKRIRVSDPEQGSVGHLVAGSPAKTLQSTRLAQPCQRCSPQFGSLLLSGGAQALECLVCAALLPPGVLARTALSPELSLHITPGCGAHKQRIVALVWFLRWAQLFCEGLNASESLLAAGWISSICELGLCFALKSAGCRLLFKVLVKAYAVYTRVWRRCICAFRLE